jgi:hypothetical protein
MEEEIKVLQKKVEEIYLTLRSIDQFVQIQSEVNTELNTFLKNLTSGVNGIHERVNYLDDNLLSTIKNNNISHDAYNKINAANQKTTDKIISMSNKK